MKDRFSSLPRQVLLSRKCRALPTTHGPDTRSSSSHIFICLRFFTSIDSLHLKCFSGFVEVMENLHGRLPPILRLPSHLRRRIYLHTNVVPVAQSIDKYHTPLEPDALHLYPRVEDLQGRNRNSRYRGFSGLLCSCRVIYNEVSTLLYSSNDFFIRYWDRGSLEPLRNLSANSLSKIRCLKIILNEASCPIGYGGGLNSWMTRRDHEACRIGAGYAGRTPFSLRNTDQPELDIDGSIEGRDEPLKSGQSPVEGILSEWQATIGHLSSCIASKTLELMLVCDVDPEDIELARRVVEPLIRLPLLRNCHLRLSRIPTSSLDDLARSTVLQVRGIAHARDWILPQSGHDILHSCPSSAAASASRLLPLPPELRFRILEFTDLVTPWNEVTWSRQIQSFVASRSLCYPLSGRGEECRVHNGCQFDNCWDTYPDPPLGCFCRVKHSAYSSGCKCWEPPQNLFLVCRVLYNDAQMIFYSCNRFVIHDMDAQPAYEVPSDTTAYPFPRLAASIFLTEIVPERCLRYLRSIEFVFPPYHHECWPQKGQSALEDWARTIGWLSKRLTLPALTIRLCTAEPFDGYEPEDRHSMTKEQGEKVLAAYTRILAPLVQLGSDGLARFYAHFTWPRKHEVSPHDGLRIHDWSRCESKERAMKERAERLVMGDRYHQLLDGDGEPPDSLWVRMWTRDC